MTFTQTRRNTFRFLAFVAPFLIVNSAGAVTDAAQSAAGLPNILLMLVDDYGE